jgi:hypothetical protein
MKSLFNRLVLFVNYKNRSRQIFALLAIAALVVSSTLVFAGLHGNTDSTSGALTNFSSAGGKGTSDIIMGLSSSSVQVGGAIQITGTLMSSNKDGSTPVADATISFSVIEPDGFVGSTGQWSSANTSSDGSFSIDYIPAEVGKHEMLATYSGDDHNSRATSYVIFDAVDPAKASKSSAMTLSSPDAADNGSEFTIDGNLLTVEGNPIASASISFEMEQPDGIKKTATVTTDDTGLFQYSMTPAMVGVHYINATYGGSAEYSATTGSTATLVRNITTAPIVPEPVTPIQAEPKVEEPASVEATTVAYTYKVSPGVVKDKSGKTVYTGSNTAAIQWAIDKTASDGTVLLDQGTFSITGKIWVTCNLIGSGSSVTKLVAANNLGTDTMIEIAKRNFAAITKITVSDMELDGKGATYTKGVYGGLELVQATYCLVEDMYIHDFPKSHGIEFQASSYNNIKSCVVKNIGYGGQYGNGICGGNQIASKSTSFNTVDGCTITGCSMVGVNWEPGNDNTVKNTIIKDLKTWPGSPTTGSTIWTKNGYPASNNNKYINVQFSIPYTAIMARDVSGTVVDGCTFTGGKSPAIYTDHCSSWVIKNSKFVTAGGHCVYIYNSNKMTVSGCYLEDGSGAKTGRGVWIANDASHTSTGNIITSNQMINCQYAVYLGTKTFATVTNRALTISRQVVIP